MTNFTTDWPPAYTIRNSTRAKQVILQISPRRGLVVIVPIQRRHPKIEEVLLQKRQWIQKNLSHIQTDQQVNPPIFIPPTSLHLHAIGKTLTLDYLKTDHKYIKIHQIKNKKSLLLCNPDLEHNSEHNLEQTIEFSSDELSYLILGPIEQPLLLIKALKRFLKQIAQEYLIPLLRRLSLEIALPYKTASIRSQSTLWGSCTAAKNISLNVKLLFLPQELTRYVLLHELCHTQHLNHSNRYWTLLKRFDPNCLIHRKMLRKASQYLPTWIEDPTN